MKKKSIRYQEKNNIRKKVTNPLTYQANDPNSKSLVCKEVCRLHSP